MLVSPAILAFRDLRDIHLWERTLQYPVGILYWRNDEEAQRPADGENWEPMEDTRRAKSIVNSLNCTSVVENVLLLSVFLEDANGLPCLTAFLDRVASLAI